MPGLTPSPPPMPSAPSWVAAAVSDGLVTCWRGVFVRGGSTHDYPPTLTTKSLPGDHGDYPPVGVVVGAGAAGALAGELSRARAHSAFDCLAWGDASVSQC